MERQDPVPCGPIDPFRSHLAAEEVAIRKPVPSQHTSVLLYLEYGMQYEAVYHNADQASLEDAGISQLPRV